MPHLLVVEDHADVRLAMRLIFENAGFRVSEAATLAAASAGARTEMPDVILLDLTLPDGDGLTLLSGLAPRTSARPVIIALTGHDDDATRRHCLALGCHDVLLKPVPSRDLVRIVRDRLA